MSLLASLGAQALSPLRSEILNHRKESGHFGLVSIVWTGTGHQTKRIGLQDHPCLHFLKILKECECQLPLSSGKETLGGSRMLLLRLTGLRLWCPVTCWSLQTSGLTPPGNCVGPSAVLPTRRFYLFSRLK